MNKNASIRILLVDDEPLLLKLLARKLTDLGFTSITACSSGAAALVSIDADKVPPDLIVCDLNMPEMDGIEFVRHLVERRFAGSLVFLSGEDQRTLQSIEKLARAHTLLVLGSLRKPVNPEALGALFDKWSPPLAVQMRPTKRTYTGDEVRTAIANRDLINYYQPTVAVADGHVVGVETLVRWRHPVDGMVYPDQFIGVAEANGLIDDLTRVVLSDALAQARNWHDAGLALRVAVNISMDNLASLDFADFVISQAAQAGVAAKDLVLEVTESRLMGDQRVPLEILTRLRLKRFGLSIDDFGTGHSSLSQLRDIPFDELKIDQSFVHGAATNSTARAIFDASLGLAQQLNMEIVAEGVEDQADWDFLQSTECHLAQGYFIARPMPEADIPGWIENWQARIGELLPTPK